MQGQLKYPLDSQTKKLIRDAVEEFLEDDIYSIIWKRTFHFLTFFESLDGYNSVISGAGTTVLSSGDEMTFTTGAVTNNANEIVKQPSEQGLITFSRKSNLRSAFNVGQVTNQTAYIVIGGLSDGSYYGFKLVNATLSGVVFNETTESTQTLATIVADTTYGLEARYSPNDKVVFFVDANEKGTISNSTTTPLPLADATANTRFLDIKITANADEQKVMRLSFVEYLQHRNVLR